MGETGVGTKREDCETLLDGVGLPAKSSYYSYSLFFYFFIFFFSFSICLFNPKKWRMKNWGERKMYKTKMGMEVANSAVGGNDYEWVFWFRSCGALLAVKVWHVRFHNFSGGWFGCKKKNKKWKVV